MKSRIDKLMRKLEEKFYTKFLSTGSCRLCKICNLQNKLGCRHPDKMRYSLEATSVDCDFLSKRLFNIPLLWFREEKAPEYSCVLAGLICNFMDVENIKIELESLLKNIA
jgi:predicted metal-binding protein